MSFTFDGPAREVRFTIVCDGAVYEYSCWTPNGNFYGKGFFWRAGRWDQIRAPSAFGPTERPQDVAIRRARRLVETGAVPEDTRFEYSANSPRTLRSDSGQVFKM